jgi:hypothetical protein
MRVGALGIVSAQQIIAVIIAVGRARWVDLAA